MEGLSYISLILIAVPVKYIFNSHSMVKYLGMPHGILFIMYLLASIIMKKNNEWVKNNFILVLIASIIPFGTFVVDYKLKKTINNFKNGFFPNKLKYILTNAGVKDSIADWSSILVLVAISLSIIFSNRFCD